MALPKLLGKVESCYPLTITIRRGYGIRTPSTNAHKLARSASGPTLLTLGAIHGSTVQQLYCF
jgi:hypothetical protein